MKPNLYICHTAYQVLVDLLRAGRCACENGPHTMVLSASVPDTAVLAARLDAAGVVKTVIVDETKWPGTVTGPFAHQRAARAFEKLCGWKFDRAAYETCISTTIGACWAAICRTAAPGISCVKTRSAAPLAPTSIL